jgi:hypothetical protein
MSTIILWSHSLSRRSIRFYVISLLPNCRIPSHVPLHTRSSCEVSALKTHDPSVDWFRFRSIYLSSPILSRSFVVALMFFTTCLVCHLSPCPKAPLARTKHSVLLYWTLYLGTVLSCELRAIPSKMESFVLFKIMILDLEKALQKLKCICAVASWMKESLTDYFLMFYLSVRQPAYTWSWIQLNLESSG